MIIVGLGTTAMLQAMISYSQMKVVTIEKIRAQYLAEAGIQYAIWQCRKGDFTSPIAIITEAWAITVTKNLQTNGSYEIKAVVRY